MRESKPPFLNGGFSFAWHKVQPRQKRRRSPSLLRAMQILSRAASRGARGGSRGRQGSEFDNATLDEPFKVFGRTRPLSKMGCPFDSAVDESANKTLKAEFLCREQFASLRDLQLKLNDYVWWHNKERMHSTPGYMSPVEFRKAGLSL